MLFDFPVPLFHERQAVMASECERTRLIGEIARLMGHESMPDDARTAALTLIGWLARRMPGECAHALGVEEAKARQAASGPADTVVRARRAV
jgi:hypothetical protein